MKTPWSQNIQQLPPLRKDKKNKGGCGSGVQDHVKARQPGEPEPRGACTASQGSSHVQGERQRLPPLLSSWHSENLNKLNQHLLLKLQQISASRSVAD